MHVRKNIKNYMKMKHIKKRITELQEELSKYQKTMKIIRFQYIEFDKEKIKKLFKNQQWKRKENTITMAITIQIKQTLKVIAAITMATTMKAKMRKLKSERKKH